MQQRQLGSDGLVTSALGMGCMGLSQGYGPADDDESVRAIRRAAELGVTMFDTAMSYGQGHNERLIGRALAGLPWQVQVATKFGIVRDSGGVRLDGRPEHVRGYCEASLARLGVEVIDLYYLHRVDPRVPIADTIGAMSQLVAEGKVRHLGLSEVTPAQLEQAAAVHPVSAVQFEWSLLWREPEDDIIPAARRAGAGIVPYSPLGRGMLQLGGGDLGNAEMTGLALGDELGHRADRVSDRHPGIDAVQVVEVDDLGAQPGQGRLAVTANVLGPPVEVHPVVAPDDAELRGHLDLPRQPGQCPADQPFVVPPAVAHGGVEHGHAQLGRPADSCDGLVVIGWPVPLGQAHASHAEGGGHQPVTAEVSLPHDPRIGDPR